jgi:hypothetical protein
MFPIVTSATCPACAVGALPPGTMAYVNLLAEAVASADPKAGGAPGTKHVMLSSAASRRATVRMVPREDVPATARK